MLHQGKHNLAAPAALQALKTSVELFGNGNIDTTPAYFALAEANIGINCTISICCIGVLAITYISVYPTDAKLINATYNNIDD